MKTRKHLYLLLPLILLLALALLMGCATTPSNPATPTVQQSQSAESIAYKTVIMAFDAYDLGMTALRTLQKQNLITQAKYTEIKDKYGWPCWTAIKAADVAVNAWVGAKSDSTYTKMTSAFEAMYETQKLLSNQVVQLQGGK